MRGSIKETKLYWHSPWLYLLILINILVYVVVGLLARRSFKVSPGLCEVHAAKRRRRIVVVLAAGGCAVSVAILLLVAEESDLSIVFFLLALLLLVIGLLASRKLYAKKITKEYARLGGCKEPFLASLE